MGYAKELNKMTWSFSRIHMYEQCPYAFYLKYLEERDGEQNYYAANGKAMHEVFEELLSGKITLDDAPALYGEKYDDIYETTRQSTMEKTFEKCMDYLCEVDALDLDKYEVVGVELKLEFKIGKYNFVGFADLVLRDKNTGEVLLVDHKSSDHFFKKDGTPLKNKLADFLAYRHQMYLYCKGLEDQCGIKVNKIAWHHFKDFGAMTTISFVQEEYDETMQWAVDTIEKIKKDKRFEAVKEFIRCRDLCDYRNDCEYLEEDGE